MSYQVGIDLGTTYTAAAVYRDSFAKIFTLGNRAAAIPSVVLLRDDGTVLTGDAAERRAMTEPERVVREFKRRIGDSIPIIIGGAPYSAEQLTARLLEAVLEAIYKREGDQPSRIVISHPANWGSFKTDLLRQAIRLAGLDPDEVGLITEPEAAALSYAAQERVESGDVVAVYDLGGGTFDAAVLRRAPSGFEILGRPEGIERLGGIDFDQAIFSHVTSGLGDAFEQLDYDNPATLAAMARLRRDCVEAKEALSSDTDTAVRVLLPNVSTDVRITRTEFESMIRPVLLDSIEGMRRAVRTAGLEMDDVSKLLLVGGSSRIPLIAQLVSSQLGRPVGVDAHPKHAIAIGAALAASGLLEKTAAEGEPGGTTPLDTHVTVVAPAEVLAEARERARAANLERIAERQDRPDRPAASAPAAPPKAQPVPSSRFGGPPPARAPAPPPIKAAPANPAGSQPSKAQPVKNPGPPPGSGLAPPPRWDQQAPSAPANQPRTPQPAPPPAAFQPPDQGRTVAMHGNGPGPGGTVAYPQGQPPFAHPAGQRPYQQQPFGLQHQPQPQATGSRAGWIVLALVIMAVAVIAAIIIQTAGGT